MSTQEEDKEKKENQEGTGEKFFKDFGKRVDQFVKEVREASDKAEVDLKKRFEDLKQASEKLKKEVRDKEKWKEVEKNLKDAGKNLENAFKSAFKKPQ